MVLGRRYRGDVKGTRRGQNRPRKAMRYTRSRRMLGMPQVNFKRTFWLELWSPNSVSTNGFWRYYQPSLSNLPSNGEIAAMFDLYRINGIKMVFRPKWDSFDGANLTTNGTTNAGFMTVSTCVDTRAAFAPTGTYTSTTFNAFAENGNVKIRRGTRDISVFFKPTVQNTVQGLTATPLARQWISTGQTAINHKGVHVFINDQNFSGQFTQSFDVFVTYYLSCKGVK